MASDIKFCINKGIFQNISVSPLWPLYTRGRPWRPHDVLRKSKDVARTWSKWNNFGFTSSYLVFTTTAFLLGSYYVHRVSTRFLLRSHHAHTVSSMLLLRCHYDQADRTTLLPRFQHCIFIHPYIFRVYICIENFRKETKRWQIQILGSTLSDSSSKISGGILRKLKNDGWSSICNSAKSL